MTKKRSDGTTECRPTTDTYHHPEKHLTDKDDG
jgi:hypothetical protein